MIDWSRKYTQKRKGLCENDVMMFVFTFVMATKRPQVPSSMYLLLSLSLSLSFFLPLWYSNYNSIPIIIVFCFVARILKYMEEPKKK